MQRWQTCLWMDPEFHQIVPILIPWSLSNDAPPPCQTAVWRCVDSTLIHRVRSVCRVQTKPPPTHLPCAMPKDQMKRYKNKEEDVSLHQRLAGVFRNFRLFKSLFRRGRTAVPALAVRKRKVSSFPLPWLLCATHSLATGPAAAPGQRICHPFVLQKALSSELRPSMNGGNTYSFFSRAKSSCSPSASIRSFSDAGWLWWDKRQERGWERLVLESGRQRFWLRKDGRGRCSCVTVGLNVRRCMESELCVAIKLTKPSVTSLMKLWASHPALWENMFSIDESSRQSSRSDFVSQNKGCED